MSDINYDTLALLQTLQQQNQNELTGNTRPPANRRLRVMLDQINKEQQYVPIRYGNVTALGSNKTGNINIDTKFSKEAYISPYSRLAKIVNQQAKLLERNGRHYSPEGIYADMAEEIDYNLRQRGY